MRPLLPRFIRFSPARGWRVPYRLVSPRAFLGAAALVGAAAGDPLPATAQEEPTAAEERAEASALGEESEELRALRLAEYELFGPPPVNRPLLDLGRRVAIGEVPAPFTDASPLLRESTEADADRPDLAWIDDLELPSIPVRWEREVLRYLTFYRDDPRGQNIIRSWLIRERRYGPMVKATLRELGLPEDIAYVAMIESGFDPTARSHAGAVGMWQFVRGTGEEYDLTVDHWVDERMDPEASTRAGARYLRDLYERFGGWELALAAYNMGYGALLRAIRKYNTNDYWTLARIEAGLPYETTFYVSKVMACAIVGRNAERFGITGLDEEAIAFERVSVPGGTSLGRIASIAGVDREVLEVLNPELRRGRVPPGEGRSLRIPAEAQERFAVRWNRSSDGTPQTEHYTVRFGETLEAVAWRFRTTERELRELNELEDGYLVGAGLRILVPATEPRERESADEPPIAAVPALGFEYQDRTRVFYEVQGHETTTELAAFFEVTLEELERWNHLDATAVLQPGMILQLYVPMDLNLETALTLGSDDVRVLPLGSQEFHDFREAEAGRVRFVYEVREGDTLSEIGERYGLSVGSICRINQFSRSHTLQLGEEIVLYTARDLAPGSARDATDARLAAYAARAGQEAPVLDRPALADDGDGDAEAADSVIADH